MPPTGRRDSARWRTPGRSACRLAEWDGKRLPCLTAPHDPASQPKPAAQDSFMAGMPGCVRSGPPAAILNSPEDPSRDLLLQRHVAAAVLRWLSRTNPFLPSGKPGSGGERHPSPLIVSPDRTKVKESGVEQECLGAARESSFCSSESAWPVPAPHPGAGSARACVLRAYGCQ